METIFNVDDTVYHWKFGKGVVINDEDNILSSLPVTVKFDDFDDEFCFTSDGRNSLKEPPTLSFTPYDFVKGGFSQQRPLKVDTLIYVRDSPDEEWYMLFFSHFDESGILYAFDFQRRSTDKNATTSSWNEYRLTNPLLEE